MATKAQPAVALALSGVRTAPGSYLSVMEFEDPYFDDETPGYVEGGDRFDHPLPNRRVQKIIRSVAALLLASMLAAAGTPISFVSVGTAVLMLLIWSELWSSRTRNEDDVI